MVEASGRKPGDRVQWVRRGRHYEGTIHIVGNGSTGDRLYSVRVPTSKQLAHVRESELSAPLPEFVEIPLF